ncbi:MULTISPECIES: hypothetical protein [unclassified Pantoea]|uniref:hypothetical protein n=1 Tax=unclassified Pantoea TaxID=2630326 RepID=UPI001CD5AF80|nr:MULTISPECIES: hypothetical protein [unclassified Pantoea]MCA1178913.1 hypothetical protein [Pantoea sp. alder69]MCA1253774.1 hypothetical protein [Pantoea sp. alder70]MCA1267402.1 hypothetical protein [Pantoea sp. alder81]
MSEEEAIWKDFVQGMLGELAAPMTYEQAAKDAIADFRTEQQQDRIQWCAHN